MACVLAVLVVCTGPAAATPPPKPSGCPANTTSDLYVNPTPSIKRKGSMPPTGVSSPATCTFASITDAIGAADGLGTGARIILTGGAPAAPALFTNEAFPLAIPDGLTLTTSDDPDVGGGGLDPASYVVRFGGRATNAVSLQSGGLRGITVNSIRSKPATTMVTCAGTSGFDAVTLDGASSAGGSIATGLKLASGCDADAAGVRVRSFGGDGVVVDDGAGLTLDDSKVYGNGGDGLALSGATSASLSEIAFNGDDGVLINSSASATFFANDVRDNAGNGLEVHSSATSFSTNSIHNNSRSTGWNEPQVLFSGEDAGPPTFGTEADCPIGAPCFNFDFHGSASSQCADGLVNRIYSYNVADTANFSSVGLRAVNGAGVYAQNNTWGHTDISQNVTSDPSSFVAASSSCGVIGTQDPNPGPPVD